MRAVLSVVLLASSSLLKSASYLLNRVTIFISLFFGVCFIVTFFNSIFLKLRIFYVVAATAFSPFGLPAFVNFLADRLAAMSKSVMAASDKELAPDLEVIPFDYEAKAKETIDNESYLEPPVPKK